jgi:hypothetical protein
MPEVQVVPDNVTPPKYKAGDLVRVFRDPLQHGVKFGAVMRVVRSGLLPHENWAEEVELVPVLHRDCPLGEGPVEAGWYEFGQSVDVRYVKQAKQAMRAESAYANKRG